MNYMTLDGPDRVLDLIEAFRRSKTMFTAVSLGLFDRLAEAPASATTLAGLCGAHPEALTRLVDACTGLGLLLRSGDLYENSPSATRYLTRSSPDTLAGYILYSNDVLYPLWGRLEGAVRDGTHRWNDVFGLDGPLFDHFFRTPEARRTFLSGMHGLGRLSSPAIVRIFNLNRFRHLVDLGGGTGHLAIAACERYGALRATVFDLPAAAEVAREQIAGSAAAARLTVVEGDFFADPLPTADLYCLGRILHDWSDAKIQRLLARIYDALPPGGGVLIAETLLDDDRSGPVPAQMQSLNMLVCTEGRERPESEYRALLENAGFTGFEARRTGTPLDAVLARKTE
ncbi:MAG: acetylserotonin O-methyltransferase [Bryobacteraceae bacterium]|nr:acetylserotonin O-methyltransferase [Bryobacteraceae bacterium]